MRPRPGCRLARCPFASASRRPRQARCTSATPSAPSRTAPLPTRARVRSCFGSTTPMPARVVPGGEEAILEDLALARAGWDEGPFRQSERGGLYAAAAQQALAGGAVRDPDGSIRLDGTTLVRPDGTATYQLATVVDDLELGITHVIRGSDHRPNEAVHRRIAAALGATLPGGDPPRARPGRGRQEALEARMGTRLPRSPSCATKASPARQHARTSTSSICRATTCSSIWAGCGGSRSMRSRRCPTRSSRRLPARRSSSCRSLRGARTLVEAREIARQIARSRARVAGRRGTADARAVRASCARRRRSTSTARRRESIIRELKAVGGDLKALRLALTGAERGPELAAVVAALPRDEALRRAAAAIAAEAPIRSARASLRHVYARSGRAAAAAGADRDVLLRPDRLPAHPRRQRDARSSCRCGCSAGSSSRGYDDEARRQHHRHQRQDLRRRAG